ncbi:DUF2062 domain-containing protein [Coraliomargarita parva]|uniref:DUF2062 domain-containing protein n=1 Tax=Coraliomargarita parva TaxID=3014050 RepID=UPI0022B44223|nr:DUF2062 domain-containing protein [Coraliomargarita parva]
MTQEEKALHTERRKRIRRVKRWLRPLPRRATIHRYPILGRFADTARQRIYLWSFREANAIPAIYAGFIITLLPIYGIQIPLAFLFALLLRANLPILVGLQMVSNPITVWPLWFAAYQIGRHILSVIGVITQQLTKEQVMHLLHNFSHADWGSNLGRLATVFGITCLGAIVMGIFFGLVTSVAYRIIARRTVASYAVLIEKIHHIKASKQNSTNNTDA